MMIDLSKNENTSNVLDIKDLISSIDSNRYSFLENHKLHKQLAKTYNLSEDNFILGSGSSDVIFMFMLALNKKAKKENKKIEFIAPLPTFYVILDFAKALDMDFVPIHLGDDFVLDVNKIKPNDEKISIIYICNPNNPTGAMLSKSDLKYLDEMSKDDKYFILDEAYCEFVKDFNSLKMANNPNVLQARTMSKLYSLAGLRLGYAIASKDTIELMMPFYNPDRINAYALYAAIYALSKDDFVKNTREIIAKNRAYMQECFKELDIEYYPSETNFILHKIKDEKYREFMLNEGVIVGYPIDNYPLLNRISVGNEEEIQGFIKALKKAKEQGLV